MKRIQREDIQIISRHSNLSAQGIESLLKEHVYNGKEIWKKFLQLFLITLGIGFTVAGIIFFFAYNWEHLHKFAKFGLIEGLIIITSCLVLLPKINLKVRKIILTGAAFLIGVLFAVFGQIYQTGANAYDFFLAWTVFVTLWVVVSNFAPLWFLFLILINTTFILYTQQVAHDWSGVLVFNLLFIINTTAFGIAYIVSRFRETANIPNWFLYTIALASISYATIGIVMGIFERFQIAFLTLIIFASVVFVLGIWQGLRAKDGFYLSVIPFSIIVIISALLFKISNEVIMFLIVSLFIIGSVTLVIKNLIDFQKKWSNAK